MILIVSSWGVISTPFYSDQSTKHDGSDHILEGIFRSNNVTDEEQRSCVECDHHDSRKEPIMADFSFCCGLKHGTVFRFHHVATRFVFHGRPSASPQPRSATHTYFFFYLSEFTQKDDSTNTLKLYSLARGLNTSYLSQT